MKAKCLNRTRFDLPLLPGSHYQKFPRYLLISALIVGNLFAICLHSFDILHDYSNRRPCSGRTDINQVIYLKSQHGQILSL